MDEDERSNYALIRNDDHGQIYCCTKDYRNEHPLQHCTMVAIDLLGKTSLYQRKNLFQNSTINEKNFYLLNGCSIYLTMEPCIMCSMALLHSRISNVYFLQSNAEYGSLLSNYGLHRLKKTNHRFRVYQLQSSDNH